MELWEALVLGILQGLTEFIPVSSTAHVTIAGHFFGAVDPARPQAWTAFLAVIQLGTLAAVLAYFRHDLAALVRGDRATWRLALLVALATIPIAVVGLAMRDVIEGSLTKDLRVIAVALIGLGLALWLADAFGPKRDTLDKLTWRGALAAGAAQVLSLVPGSSRSGVTLTGALLTGLTREAAARLSFLMSIPAIAASGLLQLPAALDAEQGDIAALVVATLAAAVSGYLAIAWMLRWLRTHGAAVFAGYRVALGAALLLALGAGWL